MSCTARAAAGCCPWPKAMSIPTEASADAALAAANAELSRNKFVAPYLFEVREVETARSCR